MIVPACHVTRLDLNDTLSRSRDHFTTHNTLFAARMDPPTADHEGDQSGPAATSSPAHFAFLNHSSSTLPNNLPPKVDNKPLARQKRKRTRYIIRKLGMSLDYL